MMYESSFTEMSSSRKQEGRDCTSGKRVAMALQDSYGFLGEQVPSPSIAVEPPAEQGVLVAGEALHTSAMAY